MKTKRVVGMILALLLCSAAFLTGAAAAAEGESVELDEIIANMEAAMADVQNFDAYMEMAISMSSMGQDVSMGSAMEMTLFTDPPKMKMDMVTDATASGEEESFSMPVEMYLEDGVLYTGVDGYWSSQDITEELGFDMDQYMVQDNFKSYTGEFADMTLVGLDTFDGEQVYRIDSVINGGALKDVVDNSGMMASLGFTEDMVDIDAVLQSMDGAQVAFYVYADSYLFAGYEMELSVMLNNILDAVMQNMEAEDVTVEVNDCTMTVEYFNYNQATDFEVPEEAMEAEAA